MGKKQRKTPLGFKLSGKEYVVWHHGEEGVKGYSEPQNRQIFLSQKDGRGLPYEESEKFQTFWHELVHCIVYEMHRKALTGWRDEVWVAEFSELLNEAITTARFK